MPTRAASRALTGVLVLVLAVGALLLVPAAASASGASVWLTRATGAKVAENATVTTGEALTVHVSGFAPHAAVLVQFGPVELSSAVDTDASGSGSVTYTAPALKTDVYVVTASSDAADATFVVSLYNPKNPKQSASPTPTPSASKTSSTSHSSSTSTKATTSSNGSTSGSLAKTGPVQPTYGIAALVLLVVGGALLKMAAPVLLGRHERIGGAHLRTSGRRSRG